MRIYLVLCAALLLAHAALAEDFELKIPPASTTLDVKGQPVRITAWGTVSGGQDAFRLALTADLGDVQANIGPLLASQLDRSDRCGERLSVESATLAPASPSALLIAHVHYERYACIKALGKNMAKRLVGGNAVLNVKLTPSISPDGISMAADVQKIDADGSLGEVLQSGSLGAAIKEKIASGIESSLRKGLDLKSTLPPQIASAAVLRGAQFANGPEGRLWFSLDGQVRISAAQLQTLKLR
jgi:hypothetical protein